MQVVDEEDAASRNEPRRKLFESKLVPPIARPESVRRTRVLDRLDTDRDRPIVSVVAPPGYGKTTLLTQWAERSTARVAWLSVDEGDNDPESLLAYAAAALDRVEPIDLEWFRRPAPRGLSVASSVVPQLAGAMYSMSQPVVAVPRPRRPAAQPRVPGRDRRAGAPPSGRIAARDGDTERSAAADGAAACRSQRARDRRPRAHDERGGGPSPARGRRARAPRRGDRRAPRTHRRLAGRVVLGGLGAEGRWRRAARRAAVHAATTG